MIGRRLAHFQIVELLGEGGQACVYRARDTRLPRDIALKVPKPDLIDDPGTRARLLSEARAASRLHHPSICVIHDVGETDGEMWIAMELIAGPTLQQLIPPGGLPVRSVVEYGAQLADALAHAHANDVAHRDFKAQNVIVPKEGPATVIDFGIARILEDAQTTTRQDFSLTGTGLVVGTPTNMAPEVLDGTRGDARSDLWSLGIVLYQMASGQVPFRASSLAGLSDAIHLGARAPLPAAVPRPLRALIDRCLTVDPARRIAHAHEVRDELTAILRSLGGEARPLRPTRRRLLVSAALLSGLAVAVYLFWPRPPAPPAAPPGATRSLAVLPLDNLSTDPTQTFFADGMTEELIGNLGRLEGLRVISRNSVMRYRPLTRPLPEIAHELGVDFVVTGSVTPGEDSLRIRASLVQARPESTLWSDGYTRESRQVLALQDAVAREIAANISVRLGPRRPALERPVDPAAWRAYLEGRRDWNLRTPEGMERAIAHFDRALAIDPDLAVAHAGRADAYGRLSLYTNQPPRETYPVARAAAETALRLDEGLAEAHTSLAGVALFYDHDWTRARAEFERAIALQPSYAQAHHWYSIWLRDRGQFAAALQEAKRALDLDPFSPIIRVNLADTHAYARNFSEAIRLLNEVVADSAFAPAYHYLGLAYAQAGDHARAVATVRRARTLSGNGVYALGALGYVEGRAGNTAEARRAEAELAAFARQGLAVAFDQALVHVGLGEWSKAMDALERAEQERASLNELGVDPRFDPLRSDPRFRRLLERLGLPPGSEDQKRT